MANVDLASRKRPSPLSESLLLVEDTSVKECVICNHEFDEDQRCPRTLPCAHTFCTLCIHELVRRNNKRCPTCRRVFRANSAKQMGKNTTALALLERVRNLEANNGRGVPKSEVIKIVKLDQTGVMDTIISECKMAVDQTKTLITGNAELERIISQNLMVIKSDIKNKLREFEEKCEVTLQYLKHESEQMKKIVTELGDEQEKLHHSKAVLDRATTLVMVDTATDEAEALNNGVQIKLQRIKTNASRDDKIQQGIIESMDAMKAHLSFVRESLTHAMDNGDGLIENMATKLLAKEDQTQITADVLQKMDVTTRCLLLHGGLYAVQQHQSIMKVGKLSVSDSKLCLHHLKVRQLLHNLPACTVKFDDILKLGSGTPELTFLDFGNDDKTLCRVYIRLTPKSKRSQNFALMCSGEKGSSYSDTRITNVQKAIHTYSIVCGDYEKNTGEGGRALVKGCGYERGGSLARRCEVGSVGSWCSGDAYAAQFAITTQVNIEVYDDVQFGMVESGIDILAEATSLYPNMQENFRITDCGIVLLENVDIS